MTFFGVSRRRPARPNPNAQPKARDVPDILAAWDAAQAKADAEEAAAAELHRAIDARKRGNDWLSTIEAVYDVLAERASRAAALPSAQGPTPPAPQPGAAPRPDAAMLRDGAVTPAPQQTPSMPAGTGGIDDILTHGPFALLAQAYRDAFGGAIDGPSATPWTTGVDRSPPLPRTGRADTLAHMNIRTATTRIAWGQIIDTASILNNRAYARVSIDGFSSPDQRWLSSYDRPSAIHRVFPLLGYHDRRCRRMLSPDRQQGAHEKGKLQQALTPNDGDHLKMSRPESVTRAAAVHHLGNAA